ncbi:hypothetical protein ACHAWO_012399 [Cyclotella atomus]|uniref:Uncharacterized protein n=1 Tax=Cyclotella atomus TaxID=382360 RepID=A0ABD3MWG5_9STRA
MYLVRRVEFSSGLSTAWDKLYWGLLRLESWIRRCCFPFHLWCKCCRGSFLCPLQLGFAASLALPQTRHWLLLAQ